MSDSWSSKLVMNKSVHEHRAEISSELSSVVYSLDTRKVRYLSRDERGNGGRKKRGGIGKRNGVVVIQLGCKIFIARECTNFLPFPPPFIKSSFFVSRFVRFHPREIVRKISFSRSERYLRSLSFRIKSPFHASEMFSK